MMHVGALLCAILVSAQGPLGPMPPPANGTTLWQFCDGKADRCTGGMGSWWSPDFARNGTALVVVALGKSSTNPAHTPPTHVELRRSTDGGHSFGAATVVVNGSTCNEFTGCDAPDPSTTSFNGANLVFDSRAGVLHALFSAGRATGGTNLSIVSSADFGATWSAAGPVVGSGGQRIASSGQVNGGVQLRHGPRAGRLVVPRYAFLGNRPPTDPDTPEGFANRAGVIFSDDAGATWAEGDWLPPPEQQEEPAIAELTNGSLVMTCRNGQNRSASNLCSGAERCRVFARSDDGGASWARMWSVAVDELPAHRCEAGMTSADLDGHPTGLLVFGAPMNASTGDRTNYTLYTSLDGGDSWQWARGMYGLQAGYSATVVLGTERLGSDRWRVDVGAGFQLGHGITTGHVEGGGYDLAYARASFVVGPGGAQSST